MCNTPAFHIGDEVYILLFEEANAIEKGIPQEYHYDKNLVFGISKRGWHHGGNSCDKVKITGVKQQWYSFACYTFDNVPCVYPEWALARADQYNPERSDIELSQYDDE